MVAIVTDAHITDPTPRADSRIPYAAMLVMVAIPMEYGYRIGVVHSRATRTMSAVNATGASARKINDLAVSLPALRPNCTSPTFISP